MHWGRKMPEFVKDYFNQLKQTIDNMSVEDTKKAVDIIYNAYKENRQIFIIGNGGSATTASHLACDLNKGTIQRVYDSNERRFRVISMADNISILTAYANDLSYDDIFSQQLKNLVNKGDVVISITGSGNSKNIINGIKTAAELGAVNVAFLGFEGGEAKTLVDHQVLVPSDHYGRIEDLHMVLCHLISTYITDMKKKESKSESN
ncbi:SIS domain-containing protein [Candidatus Woesearchaeota archaeon]|nr:SIS domain-containing protein [Candidatus Woesearchaeota archaeon]